MTFTEANSILKFDILRADESLQAFALDFLEISSTCSNCLHKNICEARAMFSRPVKSCRFLTAGSTEGGTNE